MTVILRKLTKKTILGYGKYRELTVQSVFNIGRKEYIKWSYYNLSNITFADDILDELEIIEKNRIEKPGKNADKWDNYQEFLSNSNSTSDLEKKIRKKSYIKREKAKNSGRFARDKIYYSKGSMASRNQGKY